MTTDENLLDIMLDRATSPDQETVDALGVQMFCMVLGSNSQLIQKAHEIMMAKIRSNNVLQATRAIELLEECMSKCGEKFQCETSKNRFLNNFIRLVSKKYDGAETPVEVKQRIMRCLLLWTTEYPLRQNITDVYNMLCKEFVVETEQITAIPSKQENLLGIDEEKLVNLIRSKDPENYKRANMLIQCRVSQETRRKELILQQKNQIQEVDNLVELLGQMLDAYEKDANKISQDADTLILLNELYTNCKKHKPIMKHLHELIENTEEELIAEALQSNDLLLSVMKRYKNIVQTVKTQTNPTQLVSNTTTTSLSATSAIESPNADLLANLLGGDINDFATTKTMTAVPKETLTIQTTDAATKQPDGWSKIFEDVGEIATTQSVKNYNELFADSDMLKPIIVKQNAEDNKSIDSAQEKRPFPELRGIDKLSEDLFKEILPANERVGSFKRELEKVSLNDLAREKQNTKPNEVLTSPVKAKVESNEEKVEMFTDTNINNSVFNNEDVKDIVKEDSITGTDEDMLCTKKEPIEAITYLSEININLHEITPTLDDRVLTKNDDDIIISLLFTKDHPSKNVGVIVVSITNLGKKFVKDFQFEASVKKPSKVRLLKPTHTDMPPCQRNAPPTSIKQIMLVLNPTGSAIELTCIFGYKLGDDPDPIKESIVAKDIPFFE